MELDDPQARAHPVYDGVDLRCGPYKLLVSGGGDYGSTHITYGRLYFFEVPTGRRARIDSSAACAKALARFEPGSLEP